MNRFMFSLKATLNEDGKSFHLEVEHERIGAFTQRQILEQDSELLRAFKVHLIQCETEGIDKAFTEN